MYRARHARSRPRRRWPVVIVAIAGALALTIPAFGHTEVSLPGSNFEIDEDANLKVDHAGKLDWANVNNISVPDTESGPDDESFGQGAKENTANPTVVDGSIPPNKSDLKFFGLYQEGDDFLHLYWSRVQDPQGTTNMDFELNKNKCDPADPDNSVCAGNGITPARSEGDVLIIYDLAQGGTHPELFVRFWTGSQWGPAINLSDEDQATGSINTSPIPDEDSDGLGPHSARTFGEASIDLDAIAEEGACLSFGSAYLKSRSSDSFTAALKDFVPPEPVSIGGDCGAIKVTKSKKHAAAGGTVAHQGVTFTLKQGTTTIGTAVTDANGVVCFDELPFTGTGTVYTVIETLPAGYSSSLSGTPPSTTVTVNNQATCDDPTFDGETLSVTNTPLSDITVSFSSQVTGGTASKISCTGLTATPPDGTPNVYNDTSETFVNLAPGMYTCTIDIDP